jgi:hypothetical protein
MHTEKNKAPQNDKQFVRGQMINLNDYAGDEEDHRIAAEEAATYCEDCERAINNDRKNTGKDPIIGE